MSTRDWPEDATHENGNYWCVCHRCSEPFTGHKRRVTCKVCAQKGQGDKATLRQCLSDIVDAYDWWAVDESDRAQTWRDAIEDARKVLANESTP